MNRIQKIKAYFTKYDIYTWKEFDWNDYDLKSKTPDNAFLLDVGIYIRNTLTASEEIGNKRHRLKESAAISCNSLDDLIPFLKEIVLKDYRQTIVESNIHNWDFHYFVSEHQKCANTICLFNALKERNKFARNCVYPIASVRKYQNNYFCWTHLE